MKKKLFLFMFNEIFVKEVFKYIEFIILNILKVWKCFNLGNFTAKVKLLIA